MIPHNLGFLTIQDASNWFEHQKIAHETLRRIITESFKSGSVLNIPHKYSLLSLDEVQADLDSHFSELRLISCFQLISSAEGRLKYHFQLRVSEKTNTNLSREFKAIFDRVEKDTKRLDIEGHVVEIWKKHFPSPSMTDHVGKFKSLMKYRNWIAHGRFLEPNKLGRALSQFDPVLVQRELEALFKHLNSLPEDFKWL